MDSLESLLNKVNQKLENSNLFYLSNDPERALGLEDLLKNFHICFIDDSQYTDYFVKKVIPHFSLKETNEEEIFRSSVKLIKSPEFLEYFNKNKKQINYIQTFKISSPFAFQVGQLRAISLNTSSKLNRSFEDKISQYENISNLGISLPKTIISELGKLNYQDVVDKIGNQKFVVQFDRGHTGSGTYFIDNENGYLSLQNEFKFRHVKISELIDGRAYTINGCVGKNGVYMGGLSAQITGVDGLTNLKGATIGNDWAFRKDLINGADELVNDVVKIGNCMRASGYKGLFGVDLIVTPTGLHKIIEINARQPASIPMYTKMQIKSGEIPLSLIHLAEFMGINYEIDVQVYNLKNLSTQNYSQIFIRPLEDFVINNEFKLGIYALRGDSIDNDRKINDKVNENVIFIDEDKDKILKYIGDGYSIASIDGEGFVVLSQKKGRVIKENAELSRIQINQEALDNEGELKGWIKEVLLSIKDYQK